MTLPTSQRLRLPDRTNGGLVPAATYEYVLHTDYRAEGGDVTGDGSLERPFKTVQAAAYWLLRCGDWSAYPMTLAVIQLADGVTDELGLHWSPHALVGASGGRALTIRGGQGSRLKFVQAYWSVLTLQNIELANPAGNGLESFYRATVYLLDVRFGACAASHINLRAGSVVMDAGCSIVGNAQYHIATHAGHVWRNGFPLNVLAPLSMTAWVDASGPAEIDYGGPPVNLNGHSYTGGRVSRTPQALVIEPDGTGFPGV